MTKSLALKKVPIFSDLTDKELDLLLLVTTTTTYGKNETIIHRQDEGDTFFLIMKGRVKVVLDDDEGKEFIVGILTDPDFFGEISLLDGEPRSASVVAMDPTEVIMMKREDFLVQITRHPEMCIKILTVLGRRLRKANQNIESLVFLDVCGRVARVLIEMSETQGKDEPEGTLIRIEHNRVELANLVGTTRETLTRALKTLEHMGYIRIKRNAFLITNKSGLYQRIY